jgi:uncharacterized protein YbjT (DUF2867 family)
MAEKKIIAIVGATGAQGGGLARAILNDPNSEYTVRAITRKVDSDKAKELAAMGAEVVYGDIDDLESTISAFKGAWGAFCITNFWEHFSAEREISQAANMAEAAKVTDVKHVIWSSLEDTRKLLATTDPRMPVLHEKYNVPHFDGKGEADGEFTRRKLPVTIFLTSFYWDNFIYFGLGPTKGPDGKYSITFPMGSARLPGIAAEDIGACAYSVFKRSDEFIGKTVGVAGEHLTGHQLADTFSRVLGQEVCYNAVDPDLYRSFGFPGADEMGNMFQYKRDFETEFVGVRDLDVVRSLHPELMTFESWLSNKKNLIQLG